jgi:hypothetical protein
MNNRVTVIRDAQYKNAQGEILGMIPQGIMLKRVETVGSNTVVVYGGNNVFVATEDVVGYLDVVNVSEIPSNSVVSYKKKKRK